MKHLKFYRRQVIWRTNKRVNDQRLPWTEAEKEELRKIIADWIDKHPKEPINWIDTTTELEKRFDGVIKAQGAQMSRPDGSSTGLRAQTKLKDERVGGILRTETGVEAQAKKYTDIKKLLQKLPKPKKDAKEGGETDAKTPGKKTPKPKPSKTEKRKAQESDDEEQAESPAEKPKVRRTTPPPPPKKDDNRPPPPPPAGGAGGVAGPMEGVEFLVPAATPIEGH